MLQRWEPVVKLTKAVTVVMMVVAPVVVVTVASPRNLYQSSSDRWQRKLQHLGVE